MEEEKQEGTPNEPENTPQPDSQPEGTPPETDDIDWEQRYKDLQADHTRTSQRLADIEREAETPPEEPPDEEYDDGQFLDKSTAKQMIKDAVSQAVSNVRKESANRYFRKNYPDLVKYENAIAGIMRSPKDPAGLKGASFEERIDSAVKEFKALTEEQVKAAAEKAEADAKEREEKNKKAAGLGGPSTPPSKGDEEGQSDAEELAARKARNAKKRGLA